MSELPEIGDNAVWVQESVINELAANRTKEAGLTVAMDKCTANKPSILKKENSIHEVAKWLK